jgi:thymidylate kinase
VTRGFFFVFEGVDGSGKSSALAYVQNHLTGDGVLDVEAEQALARSRGRLIASGSEEGRFEALDLAFHRREPPARHVVIDASQRQQLVKGAALEAVLAALARRDLQRRRNLASHGL